MLRKRTEKKRGGRKGYFVDLTSDFVEVCWMEVKRLMALSGARKKK